MEVIVKTIYEGHLYAVQYGNRGDNEMDRLFDEWNDMETVYNFMVENEKELQRETWRKTNTPLLAAKKVTIEAEELEDIIYELCENSEKGRTPDLDSLFQYLEGKYRGIYQLVPTKGYGPDKPSMLRLYAIKIEPNVYLITGGGIKLADTIQNSPGLKDHVIQNIDRVREWLRKQGIEDREDLIQAQN